MLARTPLPLVAINLNMLSNGYPLLDLSRRCGVTYAEMLNYFEDWTEDEGAEHQPRHWWAKRWAHVLPVAFTVLLRNGIIFHPQHPPSSRPDYPPAGLTVGEQVWPL